MRPKTLFVLATLATAARLISGCTEEPAAPMDAGPTVDAGPYVDAGRHDAAQLDAATDPDATTPDAGDPPLRQYVFVSAKAAAAVHVFDFDTLERVSTIAVGASPAETIATPDGRTVWTICGGAAEVAFIDTATLAITRTVPVGASPVHSYLSPSRAELWVGNDASGDASIIDMATFAEARVLTGNGHHKMAFVTDPTGALAFGYISNITDSTLSVLDAAHDLVANVSVGPAPHGMDYSHLTQRVYNCSGDAEHTIEVLDTTGASAHTVTSRIALPARCGYLHVSEDGRYAYATIGGADLFARVNLETEVVETFPAGDAPDKFEIVGDLVFAANVLTPTVTVIDMSTSAIVATIDVGHATVVSGRGHRSIQIFEGRLFVPNDADGTVSVIDIATRAVVATLTDIPGATNIAVAGGRGGTTYPR